MVTRSFRPTSWLRSKIACNLLAISRLLLSISISPAVVITVFLANQHPSIVGKNLLIVSSGNVWPYHSTYTLIFLYHIRNKAKCMNSSLHIKHKTGHSFSITWEVWHRMRQRADQHGPILTCNFCLLWWSSIFSQIFAFTSTILQYYYRLLHHHTDLRAYILFS